MFGGRGTRAHRMPGTKRRIQLPFARTTLHGNITIVFFHEFFAQHESDAGTFSFLVPVCVYGAVNRKKSVLNFCWNSNARVLNGDAHLVIGDGGASRSLHCWGN